MDIKLLDRSNFFRLLTISTIIALLTSRATLVLHEFVGHGLAAYLCGGSVNDYFLYLFSGGFVVWELPDDISLGRLIYACLAGMGVELIIGVVLLIIQWRLKFKRGSLIRFVMICFASIDIIHALWYLVMTVHYGYSDGTILHHVLNVWRPYFVAFFSVILTVTAYLLSRIFRGHFSSWLGGLNPIKVVIVFMACATFAGGLHLALAVGEESYFPSARADIFKTAGSRQAEEAYEQYLVEVAKKGVELSEEEKESTQEKFKEEYRAFPIAALVNGSLIAALALGLYPLRRTKVIYRGKFAVPQWQNIIRLLVILLSLLVVVLLLKTRWGMGYGVTA